jgi:hypothetical protein
MWTVITAPLFRNLALGSVVESLDLALPAPKVPFACKSAIAQARQKVGSAPFQELFRQAAPKWVGRQPVTEQWRGLTLWAMDGTSMKIPDTKLNRSTFGAQSYASGKVSSYPQVRIMALVALAHRIVAEVEFGPYAINEMKYAAKIVPRIPDRSLTILDKGFYSAALLLGLMNNGQDRHFLIPAKTGLVWKVLDGGTDDDFQVEMTVSQPARAIDPNLQKTWILRVVKGLDLGGSDCLLLTSLLDRHRFPANEIAEKYSKRWQAETAFLEIKQEMLQIQRFPTLRSHLPDGIAQELWGLVFDGFVV